MNYKLDVDIRGLRSYFLVGLSFLDVGLMMGSVMSPGSIQGCVFHLFPCGLSAEQCLHPLFPVNRICSKHCG